jgi:monofunctional biosynthetic peptidoglycan transglycosylase
MKENVLIDFGQPREEDRWEIVLDGVMGGLSQGRMKLTRGVGIFAGELSLENDGGFASVRSAPRDFRLAGYDGLILRVRGDGKRYRLRLRTEDAYDGIAYQAVFLTEPDEWLEPRVSFDEFAPVFRGRIVTGAPVLEPGRIRRIGVMIADGQRGPFRLEIAWIKAYAG